MNEEDFLTNYLHPSGDRLDRKFTHLLPAIDGLKKSGDFIIQCELEDTFSTSIMAKYTSEVSGVRLVEAYMNTQNKTTGVFIRLVGTINLVKTGYPFLILDAAVRNVSPVTREKEHMSTRVEIHLPQADHEQSKIFFDHLSEQAEKAGISYRNVVLDTLPDFWGIIWLGESNVADLDMIEKLRNYAWSSYKRLIDHTKEKNPFDYKPLQERMVFTEPKREMPIFKRIGLSVPVESQAAFFSVMVSGV